MSEFDFSGTWDLREALDQLPAQYRVQAERILSERFFLVRDRDVARLSTIDLQGCHDEACQLEAYIFRPVADRVASGDWEIWGHSESISQPIQRIPLHFLDILVAWDFRNSTLQEWRTFSKTPAFFEGVRIRDISTGHKALANEKLNPRVIDELLYLHLGGALKQSLSEYIDLISSTNDDLTDEAIEAALRKECPRLHDELVTGRPQLQTFDRTSYIGKIGKKLSVQWSVTVETLLLRMRHDSPALESWGGLYRVIREIVGGGKTPTDKAIKDHFNKNYPRFFNRIKATSRIS